MMQWRPLRVATASLQKKRARPAAPIVLMSITPPQDSGAREGNPSILDAQREFHGARQRGRERIAADRSPIALARDVLRSEEHTSELQSLMRISYAVFCLKKKKNNSQGDTEEHQNDNQTQTRKSDN